MSRFDKASGRQGRVGGARLVFCGAAISAALALGAALSGGAFAQAEQAENEEPQGLYTEEQAEFGRHTFMTNCVGCHSMDMVRIFRDRRTVQDWYGFVRNQMPFENENGLTQQQYTSLVAFFMHENGFLPGDEELVADFDLFTSIDPKDPSTGLR